MYKHLAPADLTGLPEKVVEFMDCPGSRARCLAFNRHGTLLAVGCESGQVVIWDYLTQAVDRSLLGHSKEVTSLTWSRCGRQLLSAGLDGRLVIWALPCGSQAASLHLPEGVSHVSTWRRHLRGTLAVSLTSGAALLLSLPAAPGCAEPPAPAPLPLIAMEGEGRNARLRFGADATQPAGAPAQLALLGACGRLLFLASKGTLGVLRSADLEVLDVVKIPGLPAVVGLQQDRAGGRLLVNCSDGVLRLYVVQRRPGGQGRGLDRAEAQEAVARKHLKSGSPLYPDAESYLRPTFEWSAPLQPEPFACAAFSRDGEQVLGVADRPDEQVVYFWSTKHAGFMQALECGKDAPVAMAFHPCSQPMQLLTVGATGRIYIWSRLFVENWGAFAPGFSELCENREHFEREDEFDADPLQPGAGAGGSGEDEELDVTGGAPGDLSEEDAYATDYGDEPRPGEPLLFLPAHVRPEAAAVP